MIVFSLATRYLSILLQKQLETKMPSTTALWQLTKLPILFPSASHVFGSIAEVDSLNCDSYWKTQSMDDALATTY